MEATISEQDRQILIEQFNATDDVATLDSCLPQLFEHAAESYSNNIAVVSGNTELSY